jgi:cysteine desulfurase
MTTNARTYLDWNATAPVTERVREEMARALGAFGNPSSIHAEGRAARRIVEDAREKVAALVGGDSSDVIFTSGGAEANHLALSPGALGSDATLIVSAIEHPSVRAGGRFGPDAVFSAPVTEDGAIDLENLADMVRRHQITHSGPFMLAIMAANNETGAIQPVAEAASIAREAGGAVHCDAVQMAGKKPLDMRSLGVDTLALAAHKIGGPKGVGALVVRDSGQRRIDAMFRGGGQERGWRAGTENVAGIAGFGAAAEDAAHWVGAGASIAALRDRIEAGLTSGAPDLVVFARGCDRLPNTSCFAAPGLTAETTVMALDLAGVAVSSGSACSSGRVKASHVLDAMGVGPELSACAVRVSIGPSTTEDETEKFLGAWAALHSRFKERRAAA